MKLTIFVLLFLVTVCASNKGCGHEKGKCYEYARKDQEPDCCNQKPLPDPCSNVTCESGTKCVVHHIPKPGFCGFLTKTSCDRPCPLRKCAPYCVPTRQVDQCPGCYCNQTNPPENPCSEPDACTENQECVLQEVICKKAPCLPVKQCRAICEPVSECPKNCFRYKDVDGCDRCHCCNNCVNTKCGTGEKCVLNILYCLICPCPAFASCVKEN